MIQRCYGSSVPCAHGPHSKCAVQTCRATSLRTHSRSSLATFALSLSISCTLSTCIAIMHFRIAAGLGPILNGRRVALRDCRCWPGMPARLAFPMPLAISALTPGAWCEALRRRVASRGAEARRSGFEELEEPAGLGITGSGGSKSNSNLRACPAPRDFALVLSAREKPSICAAPHVQSVAP